MLRLVLLAAALAAAAPAQAFTSSNRMRVEPTGPVTFSVSARGGNYGAADFWCAAGEYADRRLNARQNTPIFRLSEPPRRSGQPVVFSLDPTGRASSTGLATLGRDDGAMSVAAARNQCEVLRLMRERR
jgi:hypothetical protein